MSAPNSIIHSDYDITHKLFMVVRINLVHHLTVTVILTKQSSFLKSFIPIIFFSLGFLFPRRSLNVCSVVFEFFFTKHGNKSVGKQHLYNLLAYTLLLTSSKVITKLRKLKFYREKCMREE